MGLSKYIPVKVRKFIRKYICTDELYKMSLRRRKKKLVKFFYDKYNYRIDLCNPRLFTEKIQWLKLFYNNPELSNIVDKCEFKKFVKNRIGDGYTAEIIKIWDSPEQVSLSELPNKCVIKSNCQSDGKFICLINEENRYLLKDLEDEIKTKWFLAKNTLKNSFCSAYYNVTPKVFVEEYLEQQQGLVNDYKVFCFNGKPEFFYVAEEHFVKGMNVDDYPISFFDLEWNYLDVRYGNHKVNDRADKPKHLKKMVELSRELSKGFPFVRVDFFDTNDKLYVAELTFYPGGGMTPYYPESFNEKMGELLILPKKRGKFE